MTDAMTFNPDWISAPGDTIADILSERQISAEEFGRNIGRDRRFAKRLMLGCEIIDRNVAERLSSALGASESFWLNREKQYRTAVQATEAKLDPHVRQNWLAGLPLQEMKQLGWLEDTDTLSDAVQCLRFFGVPTVDAWNEEISEMLGAASLRTSQAFKSEPGAMAAWIRKGELQAATIQCRSWDPVEFQHALTEIRTLTREADPKVFIPKLQSRCAMCGVAVVVERAPVKCKASGSCRVLPRGTRLLLLSFRHLQDDHFWFTFFHEAGHLLLHGDRLLYIDSQEEEENQSAKDEAEASDFAADTLIPRDRREEMLKLPVDGRRVMRFARDIGIAPGIVVGQMQHLGALTRRQLNNLKSRYHWTQ